MSAIAAAKIFVDGVVQGSKVAVFSKSYCPYCTKAKNAISSLPVKPGAIEVVEIENRDDMDAIQDYLLSITGGRSVPRVFIGGKFFGGGDDTAAALKSGKLEQLLKEVGAL